MKFLLDTDSVSYAMRGAGRVGKRIRSHRPSEIAVSAVTVAELRFGAHKRGSRKLHRLISAIIAPLAELPFDFAAADRYGRIAADLQSKGETIGIADAMIGAQALELGLVLVTHNVRHFGRIEDLEIMDWY